MKLMICKVMLLLSLLASCSSAVRVSPLSCQSESMWYQEIHPDHHQIVLTERFFLSPIWGDDTIIRPEKMLRSADIACDSITQYSYELQQDFWSIVGSLVLSPSVVLTVKAGYRSADDLIDQDIHGDF